MCTEHVSGWPCTAMAERSMVQLMDQAGRKRMRSWWDRCLLHLPHPPRTATLWISMWALTARPPAFSPCPSAGRVTPLLCPFATVSLAFAGTPPKHLLLLVSHIISVSVFRHWLLSPKTDSCRGSRQQAIRHSACGILSNFLVAQREFLDGGT